MHQYCQSKHDVTKRRRKGGGGGVEKKEDLSDTTKANREKEPNRY